MKKTLTMLSVAALTLGISTSVFAAQAIVPQTAGVIPSGNLPSIFGYTLVINNMTSNPKVINLVNGQGNGVVTLNRVDTVVVPPNSAIATPIFWGMGSPTNTSSLNVGLAVNGTVAPNIFQFVTDPYNSLQHYVLYNSNAMYNFGKFNVCTTQMGNNAIEIDIS